MMRFFSGMILKFRDILVSVLEGTNLWIKSRDLNSYLCCAHLQVSILKLQS